MFKKRERLTQSEFQGYFKIGNRHHSKHLTLITTPFHKRKVAVVVGKKVVKSAVKRNGIKRRIFATLRREFGETATSGVLIVLVKPTFATLSHKAATDNIITEVARVWKSA